MKQIGVYTFELDGLELKLYNAIKAGKKVTSAGDKNRVNALTRLRRNGLIENHGTAGRPEWRTSDKWKSWPYNYHTTIILPDGESNQDEILLEINRQIESAEELVASLKQIRDDYVATQDQAANTMRSDQNYWRKFSA